MGITETAAIAMAAMLVANADASCIFALSKLQPSALIALLETHIAR